MVKGAEPDRRRWVMLVVVFLARISTGFQFQSVAAVAPVMMGDLELSYAELGWLIGLFSLPGVVTAMPGGAAGQRFGERPAALAGLSLMAVGAAITAGAPSFPMAAAGRLVSGVGGIVVNLAFAKMIAAWFVGKETATAMGVMLTAWPVGMGLALLTLGAVAQAHSWRAGILVSSAVAVAGLALLAALYRDPPAQSTAAAAGSAHLTRAEVKLAILAGLTWSSLNAALFVFVSFAPGVLVAQGYSVGRAGSIVSLALWVTLVSIPAGGLLADRTKRHDQMVALGALATAICMAAFGLLPAPVAWVLIAGLAIGPAPGPAMSLLPRAIGQEHLSRALGIYYCVFYAGVAGLQPVAGFVLDATGRPAAPILVAAVAMALTIVGLVAFRRATRPRLPV